LNKKYKKLEAVLVVTIMIMLVLSCCGIFIVSDQKKGQICEKTTMDQKLQLDAQSMTVGSPNSEYPEDAQGSLGVQTVIQNVPAYLGYRGCGPTAAGIVLGYYDGYGFPDLVEGDASTQTSAVNTMISSQENWDDYCLPLDYYPILKADKSEYPAGDEHEDNCIADFMKTSQSAYDNYYGWSWFSDADDGLWGYVNWVNSQYVASTTTLRYTGSGSGLTWSKFCSEIDANRPVILLVDTQGDNSADHFVTAIGYDDSNNYGCYNVLDTNIHWYDFSKIATGNPWGIYGAVFCTLSMVGLQLEYSPTTYDFGTKDIGEIAYTTLEIWNAGAETLNYVLSESCNWVELTSTSGTSNGEHDQIIVSIDTTDLTSGVHSYDIQINSDGGSGIFTVSVNVVSDSEPYNQQQTEYDNKFATYSNKWIAQSFKPSEGLLTRIELYIDKLGSPTTNIIVSIRNSLTGPDLAVSSKPASQIPSTINWIEFDINDISVTPENTYYIVLRTSDGSIINAYEWGFGYYTSYTRGSFWKSDNSGSSWSEYTYYDFCFKTYGTSESSSPPNIPIVPSGPTTLPITVSGTYSTSTTDPDGNQVQYRFYWGDGTFSSWTNLVNSGQSSSKSTMWNSMGTYVVKAQARDSYGLMSGWSTGLTVTVSDSTNTAPNTPNTPTGPTNLNTGQSGTYSTSATDPDNDQVQYRFDWGDGEISSWTNLVNSGTTSSKIHSWTNADTYLVKAQTRDEHGSTSSWSTGLTISVNAPSNTAPNTPNTPTGPTNLNTGQSGTYSTSATDPDNDQVQYRFDWGDGEISSWTNLVNSGTTASKTHYWTNPGTYLVKAQTRDEHGSTSSWSTSLVVIITTSVEQLDQQQTEYDNKYATYSNKWIAQSFKPTIGTLSSVELYIDKTGNPTTDIIVSIRNSLTGPDLTVSSKSPNQIPTTPTWIEFDFNDISVTPENTYYIVIKTSDGSSYNAYEWGFGYYTSYTRGSFWKSDNSGSSWSEYTYYDFCFKTYGIPAGPPNPVLSYNPSSYTFSNKLEGMTDSTTFQIWNSGTGTLSYTLSETCNWITSITPNSGTSTGEHDTITINIDTTGLTTGFYTYDISINSNGGNNIFTVSVNVVPPAPILSYNPTSYNFGNKVEGISDSKTIEIWNSGTGTLSYTLSETCNWITSITPNSGTSTGEHDTITINIDTTGLTTGSYTYDISINSNGGNNIITVSVNIIILTEQLDQQQTEYDNKFAAYSNKWIAQSFKPTIGTLTSVELYIDKTGNPTTDITVSIRNSLTGPDLTVSSKSPNQIPTTPTWIEFDFNDISITPENTYYIVIKTSGGSSYNAYEWGFGYYTSYTRGSFWKSDNSGSSWDEYTYYDFCFKTYGT
jgi:hypothetical protein